MGNIYKSGLEYEVFQYDIADKIIENIQEICKEKNKEFNREYVSSRMEQFIEDLEYTFESSLDDMFEE